VNPSPPVPTWQRAYACACAGVIGWCLVYWLADYAKLPRAFQDPASGAWRLVAEPPASSWSGYVGLWLWGLCGGAVATLTALAALRLRRTPLTDRTLALWLAWAATAFLFVGVWFTWHNRP
jgi:hypothetical protein